MISLTFQSAIPGFQVREKLTELRLLAGQEGGEFTRPGAWILEDLGQGAARIAIADDELEAALGVIHKVFPNAIVFPTAPA